ncbi:hypothetical protein Dimus_020125 [Dionaea muscipula]
MDAIARAAAPLNQLSEDVDPRTSWVFEEAADTFLIYVPEFNKENLRVQLTPTRTLKVTGQRLIGGNKWQRFLKSVQVPENCDTKKITAKFEDGILYIRQPKLTPPATRVTPPVQAQQATTEPPPQPAPSLSPHDLKSTGSAVADKTQQTTTKPPPQPVPSLSTQDQKSIGSAVADKKPAEQANQTKEDVEDAPPMTLEKDKGQKEVKSKENLGRKGDDAKDMESISQHEESSISSRLESQGRKSSGGFFNDLKKPGNLKMATIIALVTLMGLFITSMLKWCTSGNQDL